MIFNWKSNWITLRVSMRSSTVPHSRIRLLKYPNYRLIPMKLRSYMLWRVIILTALSIHEWKDDLCCTYKLKKRSFPKYSELILLVLCFKALLILFENKGELIFLVPKFVLYSFDPTTADIGNKISKAAANILIIKIFLFIFSPNIQSRYYYIKTSIIIIFIFV